MSIFILYWVSFIYYSWCHKAEVAAQYIWETKKVNRNDQSKWLRALRDAWINGMNLIVLEKLYRGDGWALSWGNVCFSSARSRESREDLKSLTSGPFPQNSSFHWYICLLTCKLITPPHVRPHLPLPSLQLLSQWTCQGLMSSLEWVPLLYPKAATKAKVSLVLTNDTQDPVYAYFASSVYVP